MVMEMGYAIVLVLMAMFFIIGNHCLMHVLMMFICMCVDMLMFDRVMSVRMCM